MDNIYDTEQAAVYLRSYGFKIQARSLSQYRYFGKGPQFKRLGPAVYYTKKALDTYVQERLAGMRGA